MPQTKQRRPRRPARFIRPMVRYRNGPKGPREGCLSEEERIRRGEAIYKRRFALYLPQTVIANLVGKTVNFVSRIETGKNTMPRGYEEYERVLDDLEKKAAKAKKQAA